MNPLYPLCFTPTSVERVWGGERWILSGLEGSNSVVCNGFLSDNEINELIEVYMEDLVGESVYRKFSNEFPLLVKILDIKDYLSFQVHPPDEIAKVRHNAYGKAEFWYVLDATPQATLFLGFNRPLTPAEFSQRCLNQTLPEVMHEFTPRRGDHYYIPPGTVHAAGGGLVVAEIQQVSDITYRVYDWGREFHKETAREMHTDLALDAIHWEPFHPADPQGDDPEKIIETPWFHLTKKTLTAPISQSNILGSSFRLLFCVEGAIQVEANQSVRIEKEGLILIPATMDQYTIAPKGSSAALLEVWVP
ncbi:MAG: class I mannose-6-phosphate isomerase [Bacteroidetes bacterium]|nr:class I mannose-6-phosphate isomerase [Bacteroidota bacterium]